MSFKYQLIKVEPNKKKEFTVNDNIYFKNIKLKKTNENEKKKFNVNEIKNIK
jgi:rRNA processing protein Gar1